MTLIDESFLKTLPKIDLIMSGTPCRDFSRCTIQGGSSNWDNMHSIGKGVYGKHSSLFFIFFEIYQWLKANNNKDIKVLFENVVMKKEDKEIVSEIFALGGDFEAQCRELMARYVLKILILTCGEKGSYVFNGDDVSYEETPKVEVVDTVGAGDAFTATFIASIMKGDTIRDAHQKAVEISAFVCTQEGAMPQYEQ
jgi:hypothetical protein